MENMSSTTHLDQLFARWREAKETCYYYIQDPPKYEQRVALYIEEIFDGMGFYIDPNRGAIFRSYEDYEDEAEPLFELSADDMHGWKER